MNYDKCNENIGYLCYSTYDRLELKDKCNCGSQGSALLYFEDTFPYIWDFVHRRIFKFYVNILKN